MQDDVRILVALAQRPRGRRGDRGGDRGRGSGERTFWLSGNVARARGEPDPARSRRSRAGGDRARDPGPDTARSR